MLTKEKGRKTIDRLPDTFTVDQLVEELIVLNKIEEGLKDLRQAEFFLQIRLRKSLKHG